jgi:hypothetical protein
MRMAPTVLPTDAPQELASAAQRGRLSHRKAAKSRLAAGGYVPVKILGRVHSPTVRATEVPGGHYWRRGHPPRQAFGPGRRDHQIIRIGPTPVRANLGDLARAGKFSQILLQLSRAAG